MEKLVKIWSALIRFTSGIFWKPIEQGEERAQFNSPAVLILVSILAGIFTVTALVFPAQPQLVGEFRETMSPDTKKRTDEERDRALAKAMDATQKAFSGTSSRPASSAAQGGRGTSSRDTPMILNRPGIIAGNQLAAGLKFAVRLLDPVTVSDQPVPVIAEVVRGVFTDSGGGIREGSRLFGMAQFQNGWERAQIQFQSISDSSGIVRPIKGIALEMDGQAGVMGEVHSKSLRNAAGQFVTRFISAYADGSQQRDFMGNSRGGAENGMLNAIGETAKDRTNAYAEDLKKEHQWIDIDQNKEFNVILTQTFTFNEPGVTQ